MPMTDNIGLVFATDIESKAFVAGFSLEAAENRPFRIFRKDNIILILSGIGKANAAMATSYLISKYNTKIIFNIGAAGAAKSGCKVGDIFHINSVIEYDRPRLFKKGMRVLNPKVLAGYNLASLATQDKPVVDPEHRKELSEYVDLVDMEGASVIQACRLFEAECYLFKIITDTPEHEQEEDIVKNINLTAEKLFKFFKEDVLEHFK
jgi:nucleoside phosphorylase